MLNYNLKRARANAKKIGYTVKPSTNPRKKLDVFDKANKKINSIGSPEYADFTKTGDEKRRASFKARFERFRHRKGSGAYLADQILWN